MTTINEEHKSIDLYVENLEHDCTEDSLQGVFSEFGKCSAQVMRDDLGKSKGSGLVSFEMWEPAVKAIAALNNSKLGTQTIRVGFVEGRDEREGRVDPSYAKNEDSIVCVRDLDASIDDTDLRRFFSICGFVSSAQVMRSIEGESLGFGYVTYITSEGARAAVEELNGHILYGKTLKVSIAWSGEGIAGN